MKSPFLLLIIIMIIFVSARELEQFEDGYETEENILGGGNSKPKVPTKPSTTKISVVQARITPLVAVPVVVDNFQYFPTHCKDYLPATKVSVPTEWTTILTKPETKVKASDVLNQREKMAVGQYTASFYYTINCMLTNPDYPRPVLWWQPLMTLFNGALAKLPAYIGSTYRGTFFDNEPVIGEVIRNLGYLSTSKNPTVAFNFAKDNVLSTQTVLYNNKVSKAIAEAKKNDEKANLVVIIKPKAYFLRLRVGHGKDLAGASEHHGGENEVLMLPGTCWQVESKETAPGTMRFRGVGLQEYEIAFVPGMVYYDLKGVPCPADDVKNILSRDQEEESEGQFEMFDL